MPADAPSTNIGDLVANAAADRPDAEALTDGTARLTWREYADAVDGLAGAIVAAGAAPGDRVGVHLPKSAMAFVAVHAVIRSGCVMVPLDWFAPAEYVDRIVADADIDIVVTDATGERADRLIGCGSELVPTTSRAPLERVPERTADDPAYIIYTSGSTGTPKGIVHTHGSGLAYARRAVETYGLSPDDRVVNIAPLHFDQSTFELYAAPLAGSATIVATDPVLRFPASLGKLVSAERATVWYSVPYAISQLVHRGAPPELDLSALRWVLYGGESFPAGDLRAALDRLPGARFSNVYGPAEVNQCTFHHFDSAIDLARPIPIGRPWDGIDVLLVDEDGAPVHGGQVGHLLVSGDTMMDRYWKRPDLTDAAVERRAGRRWYRTGDLAWCDAHGDLVFGGRFDHQVKVRGHRVELEAVELAMIGRAGVEASAVVVTDDQLAAIVSPPVDADGERSLLDELRRQLPPYAVPSQIVGIERMPRTGTGKVDRNAAAVAAGLETNPRGDPRT